VLTREGLELFLGEHEAHESRMTQATAGSHVGGDRRRGRGEAERVNTDAVGPAVETFSAGC
jgi:hypothetical protein